MTTATEESISQQFDVGPGAEISVSNVSGHIEIRATEGNQIRVTATKRGRDSAKENTEIEMSQSGSRVSVRTRQREGGIHKITRGMCSVDYAIEVPRDCNVHVRAVSADAVVIGTRAGLRLETVSGDVRLENLAGECSISAVSGSVDARSIDGPLRLRVTSGNVTLRNSRIPDFNCHSVSGDLTIETPLTPGEHYLAHTVSGNLHLLVPTGTGATVQMRSVSGNVSSDFPADIIRSGRRHWQGRINGGGASVEMSSVSGDLRIIASTDLAAVERSAEDAGPQSEESQREETTVILEQLERGEITVAEATARLRGLR